MKKLVLQQAQDGEFYRIIFLFISLFLVNSTFLPPGEVSAQTAEQKEKKYEIEFEFDPYYSDVAFYLSLTQRPVLFG